MPGADTRHDHAHTSPYSHEVVVVEAMPNPLIRVVIVEANRVFARGLEAMLQESPDMTVVGVASSGGSALQLVEVTRPDVVVVDYRLPDGTGADALRRLRRIQQVGAVFLSGEDSADTLAAAAWEAGATGFFLKSDSPARAAEAVRRAAIGATAVRRRDPRLRHLTLVPR
jgi:DNA-binding NarL/FixJ family response regulator